MLPADEFSDPTVKPLPEDSGLCFLLLTFAGPPVCLRLCARYSTCRPTHRAQIDRAAFRSTVHRRVCAAARPRSFARKTWGVLGRPRLRRGHAELMDL